VALGYRRSRHGTRGQSLSPHLLLTRPRSSKWTYCFLTSMYVWDAYQRVILKISEVRWEVHTQTKCTSPLTL